MYCKKCGAKVNSDEKFCQYCGQKTSFNQNGEAKTPTQKILETGNVEGKKRIKKFFGKKRNIIALVLALVVVIGSIIIFQQSSPEKRLTDNTSSNENHSQGSSDTNSDKQTMTVPNFVGMSVQEILEKYADLNIKFEYTKDNNIPAGTVISQSPAKGRIIRKSQEITITVSAGTELVEIPRIYNLSKDEAQTQLRRFGLDCVFISKHADTVTEGHVISTNPQEGGLVNYGTQIEVFISMGPETKYVDNVNCVGYTLEDAKEKIEKAGLTVGTITYEDGGEQAGVVLRQSPDIATSYCVPEGAKINLTVSLGPSTVIMPDVTGLSREDALLNLMKVGFSYNNIYFEERYDESEAPGVVIRTDPEPGCRVNKSSKITICKNSFLGE